MVKNEEKSCRKHHFPYHRKVFQIYLGLIRHLLTEMQTNY